MLGTGNVVVAHDADVLRHAVSERLHDLQQIDGVHVVPARDGHAGAVLADQRKHQVGQLLLGAELVLVVQRMAGDAQRPDTVEISLFPAGHHVHLHAQKIDLVVALAADIADGIVHNLKVVDIYGRIGRGLIGDVDEIDVARGQPVVKGRLHMQLI